MQGHYEEALGSAKRAVESLRSGVGGKDVATASALFNVGGLAKRLVRVCVALC